jgi:hypothetical protein
MSGDCFCFTSTFITYYSVVIFKFFQIFNQVNARNEITVEIFARDTLCNLSNASRPQLPPRSLHIHISQLSNSIIPSNVHVYGVVNPHVSYSFWQVSDDTF